MEERKKVCVFSLIKNIVVFLFLLWMMLMPAREIGTMSFMHFSYLLALFSGGTNDETIVFCIFTLIFMILWLISLIYVVFNIVYAAKGLKNPEEITAKKIKKTFHVSLNVFAYIMNLLSQILFYVGIIISDSIGCLSFIILFILFITVIVLGSEGKKKSKKLFANESR